MTKIAINIHDILKTHIFSSITSALSSIDLEEPLESNTLGSLDVKVGHLLAAGHKVAVIGSTDDIRSVRADLDEEQAWQVLQRCEKLHDCEVGFTWHLIDTVAYDLFGSGNAQRFERCAKALAIYDEEADVDTNLTDLLADAMHWCRDKKRDFKHLLENRNRAFRGRGEGRRRS